MYVIRAIWQRWKQNISAQTASWQTHTQKMKGKHSEAWHACFPYADQWMYWVSDDRVAGANTRSVIRVTVMFHSGRHVWRWNTCDLSSVDGSSNCKHNHFAYKRFFCVCMHVFLWPCLDIRTMYVWLCTTVLVCVAQLVVHCNSGAKSCVFDSQGSHVLIKIVQLQVSHMCKWIRINQ